MIVIPSLLSLVCHLLVRARLILKRHQLLLLKVTENMHNINNKFYNRYSFDIGNNDNINIYNHNNNHHNNNNNHNNYNHSDGNNRHTINL